MSKLKDLQLEIPSIDLLEARKLFGGGQYGPPHLNDSPKLPELPEYPDSQNIPDGIIDFIPPNPEGMHLDIPELDSDIIIPHIDFPDNDQNRDNDHLWGDREDDRDREDFDREGRDPDDFDREGRDSEDNRDYDRDPDDDRTRGHGGGSGGGTGDHGNHPFIGNPHDTGNFPNNRDPQMGNTCVFECISATLEYMGVNMSVSDIIATVKASISGATNSDLGVWEGNALGMTYSHFFEMKSITSLSDVQQAFNNDNVVFAYFTNGILEHEVVVLGIDHYNEEGSAVLKYFNPSSGIIETANSGNFSYECEILGLNSTFSNNYINNN